jgi:hypothetical protein
MNKKVVPEKNAQKPEQKKVAPLFGRVIEFEPTNPVGWYTVLFSHIHDESRDLSLWLDSSLSWLRQEVKMPYTWALLHGLGKDREITSPVFYFKDRYEALRFSWLHSGTLQE